MFATNSLTIAAIKRLSVMNVRVQRDIMLVGFDNSDVYDCFSPPIPYVRQPIGAICSNAIAALVDLIENKTVPAAAETVLDGEVVYNGVDIHNDNILK